MHVFLNNAFRRQRKIDLARLTQNGALGFHGIHAIQRTQNGKHKPCVVFLIRNRLRKGSAKRFQMFAVKTHDASVYKKQGVVQPEPVEFAAGM